MVVMYEIQQRRTALVVPVPEAEPRIQAFRARHIPTPAAKMPPHITVRGPFVPMERVDERLRSALAAFFASRPRFRFTLRKLGRFPATGVLYLVPEPDGAFHTLRRAVDARFPGAPPAFFPDPVMHLTVARCSVEEMEGVERAFYRECGGSLPIEATAREVCLFEKRDGVWHKRAAYALADRSGE